MTASIFSTIDAIQIAMERFRNINSGGCGVFAAAFAAALQAKGYDAAVTVADDRQFNLKVQPNLSEVERDVPYNDHNEWNSRGVFFGHVLARVALANEYLIVDSERLITVPKTKHPHDVVIGLGFMELPLYTGHLQTSTMSDLVSNPEGWNSCFDRSQIDPMRKKIGEIVQKRLPVAA